MIEFRKDYSCPHFSEMTLLCDDEKCNYDELFTGTWEECIVQAKLEGWQIYKDEDDQWRHHCPDHNPFHKKEVDFEEIEK